MSLLHLKELIENRYSNAQIEIVENKKGSKRIRIKDVLVCYYDEQNEMYYGETLHWWLNNTRRTFFYIPKDQVNWLLKRLEKLNNLLHKRGEQWEQDI